MPEGVATMPEGDAADLANRVLNIVKTTLEACRIFPNTCYVTEVFGSSLLTRRTSDFLNPSEDHEFGNNIRAACWVEVRNHTIFLRSEDDEQSITIELNYELSNHVTFGAPLCTTEKKNTNPLPPSPTSVIPDSNQKLSRPLAVRAQKNVAASQTH